jgi:hypothetical protein
MNYKDRITDDEFMDDFISNCNWCYVINHNYNGVYIAYDCILTDDDVERLIEYCQKMEYIS